MMRRFLFLACLIFAASARAQFTDFYCDPVNGDNRNSGSTTSGTPALSLTGGSWVSSTGVYTKTGAITGVAVNDFASVYRDGGTVAALVGRVTAVTADTVTISTTAKSGSLTDGTSDTSLRVGGCWAGPNGAVVFPFNWVSGAAAKTNELAFINFRNNASYAISAALTHPNGNGSVVFAGYATTPRDGGRATFDAGGGAFDILSSNAGATTFWDLIVTNNTGGGNEGFVLSGNNRYLFYRCKAHNIGGHGFRIANVAYSPCVDCEATNCGTAGSAATAGFYQPWHLVRCWSHHNNTNANIHGVSTDIVGFFVNCVFSHNGGKGVYHYGNQEFIALNCDFYANGSDGLGMAESSWLPINIQNCNFVDNGGYGFSSTGNSRLGWLRNCAFGAGSMANGSGAVNIATNNKIIESGSVTYPTDFNPFRDAANGDFTIVSPLGKNIATPFTGAGLSSNMIGYPSIGAAQARGSAFPRVSVH